VEQKSQPAQDLSQLSNWSLSEFLKKLSSEEPIPGGGSVAALAGALGAALIVMYCKIGASRKNATVNDQETLQKIRTLAESYQAQLTRLITDDSLAYGEVMQAFKLPKTSEEEIKARQSAIQKAFHQAAEVPLQTLHACLECLALIAEVSAHGSKSAFSDLKVAESMCQSGARGAIENVEINLPSIKDAETVRHLESRLGKYKETLETAIRREITKPQ
jgi:methenyltetrahydrofolate cyclohydrolase